jgi:serine/threonine protein kinase
MLEPDPLQRLSAAECLEHEFFKDYSEDNKEIAPTDDTGMDEFSSPNSELGKLKDK